MCFRLGRQLDLGLFLGLRLAGSWWCPPAGDCELRSQPESVLRPPPIRGFRWQSMAIPGSNGGGRLRPGWGRFAIARIVHGRAGVERLHLLDHKAHKMNRAATSATIKRSEENWCNVAARAP